MPSLANRNGDDMKCSNLYCSRPAANGSLCRICYMKIKYGASANITVAALSDEHYQAIITDLESKLDEALRRVDELEQKAHGLPM